MQKRKVLSLSFENLFFSIHTVVDPDHWKVTFVLLLDTSSDQQILPRTR